MDPSRTCSGSDKDEYLHRLADFIHTLKTVERVEVLPYHTLGVFKWEQLEFLIRWKVSDRHPKNGSTMPEKFWERYKTGQKTGKEKDLNASDGRGIFYEYSGRKCFST